MNTITLTPEIYRKLADKIVNSLDICGECDERFEWDEKDFLIDASIRLVVYRKRDSEELNPIVDVGFLWVEFRTIDDDGDVPNDFKSDELKKYLIY